MKTAVLNLILTLALAALCLIAVTTVTDWMRGRQAAQPVPSKLNDAARKAKERP